MSNFDFKFLPKTDFFPILISNFVQKLTFFQFWPQILTKNGFSTKKLIFCKCWPKTKQNWLKKAQFVPILVFYGPNLDSQVQICPNWFQFWFLSPHFGTKVQIYPSRLSKRVFVCDLDFLLFRTRFPGGGRILFPDARFVHKEISRIARAAAGCQRRQESRSRFQQGDFHYQLQHERRHLRSHGKNLSNRSKKKLTRQVGPFFLSKFAFSTSKFCFFKVHIFIGSSKFVQISVLEGPNLSKLWSHVQIWVFKIQICPIFGFLRSKFWLQRSKLLQIGVF